MLSTISFQVEPSEVLSVRPDASLEEIREAYRAKVKRHHPDAGGEEWAFRIVSQAYEILCTARVTRAAEREANAPPRASRTVDSFTNRYGHSPFHSKTQARGYAASATVRPSVPPGTSKPFSDPSESVRKGLREKGADPSRVVEIEKLSIRFQPEGIWLINDLANADRFLSCCLNVTWPGEGDSEVAVPAETRDQILRELGLAFDAVDVQTKATTSSASVADNRFSGWLSYANSDEASAAFTLLREKLHEIGLAVNQWSRDLVIPRQWR